ncbi:uncharacterized protein C2845_PM03G33550 [Panicum miliaceum]|uniref:Uncharacterized protein n=1 Tax=Panicum miliaceum TaxID=4540 RepID=A0A3L6T5T3_PANMI|nr:uncharacterized protein C2845_PM03G33550 [Panicum miliaceum]
MGFNVQNAATRGFLLLQRQQMYAVDLFIFSHDGKLETNNCVMMLVAVLGGPLIENKVEVDSKARLLGMNLDLNHDDKRYTFLPLGSLKERLEHFQILNPKAINFNNYSLPEGVSRIIPSGFMREFNELKAFGYPLPPPLVLELNGDLLNKFEDSFGESYAWKGYNLGHIRSVSTMVVWSRLKRNVLDKISRRVVSLASFKEDIRFFVCTGLLIKLCGHTVILTSASLVIRSAVNVASQCEGFIVFDMDDLFICKPKILDASS